LIEIDLLVLEKKIFFNINTCKYGFPYCGEEEEEVIPEEEEEDML
jgi:hypothetical protein